MFLFDRVTDLLTDLQVYKNEFPNTYTKLEEVKEICSNHENDPVGSVFGVQVASDWQDKCYGFEIDKIIGETTIIRYVGTWKT